jgi:hypothetical protein
LGAPDDDWYTHIPIAADAGRQVGKFFKSKTRGYGVKQVNRKGLLMRIRTGLLIAAIGALVVTTAYADGTTNQATARTPATNGQSATIRIAGKEIPKELLEKLTGDQIVALSKDQNAIPTLAPLFVAIPLLFVVVLISVIFFAKHRRNAMLHQTLATMIEKGVPIPPELFQSSESDEPKRSNLHRGLAACGAGIGLMLFFWFLGGGGFNGKHMGGLWAVGFIPLFVGIARLIAWKLEQGKPNS